MSKRLVKFQRSWCIALINCHNDFIDHGRFQLRQTLDWLDFIRHDLNSLFRRGHRQEERQTQASRRSSISDGAQGSQPVSPHGVYTSAQTSLPTNYIGESD